MEVILFIKDLNNIGANYFKIWIDIIIQFDDEEYKVIKLNIPKGISKTTFHRIIKYGVEIFPKYVKSYSLNKKHGEIIISKNSIFDSANNLNEKTKVHNLIITSNELVNKTVDKILYKNKKQTELVYKDDIYQEIISFLNDCTGKNYKHNSIVNKKFITQRLNDGFTIDDFKKVISIKTNNWLNSQMEQFLRPETLFSNKFESYLNENIINNEKKSNLNNTYEQINIATSIIDNQQ